MEPMYFSWHNMHSASYTTFDAVQSVQEVWMGTVGTGSLDGAIA